MADLADVSDVEDMYRPIPDDETTRVESLIRYASSVVRGRVPAIDRRIASGLLDEQTARDVVAVMVTRALRNPTGVSQETIGPVSYSIDSNVGSGYIYLSDAEAALLAASAGGAAASHRGPKGIGTMRLRAPLA